jgi:hypothetical protein
LTKKFTVAILKDSAIQKKYFLITLVKRQWQDVSKKYLYDGIGRKLTNLLYSKNKNKTAKLDFSAIFIKNKKNPNQISVAY